MRLPHDCLVLVADGRKMLLLRNDGQADNPALTVVYGLERPNPADQDQKTDARGQRPTVGSPGQDSMDEADYHKRTEDLFARSVAEHINGLALRNELPPLIVVAPPGTLGALRKYYHQEAAACIRAEISREMTGAPVETITDMLKDHEEVG